MVRCATRIGNWQVQLIVCRMRNNVVKGEWFTHQPFRKKNSTVQYLPVVLSPSCFIVKYVSYLLNKNRFSTPRRKKDTSTVHNEYVNVQEY